MKSDIIFYIPSESKFSTQLSMDRILGVPLFLRGILTLESTGVDKITLVAPITERRHVLKAWNKHTKNRNIEAHFVWTPQHQTISEETFTELVSNANKTVTIINANLLIPDSALEQWQNCQLRVGQHLKADIDRGLPPITRFHVEDLIEAKENLTRRTPHIEDIVREALITTKTHSGSEKWDKPVKLVTRFSKRKNITKFLTEQIRQSTPAWIARNINKRISLPASIVLAKMRVSPNTITIINMLIGMGASVGAAGRTYVGLLIGAILFQTASIVDGCDGEVAKLTHRCTKFGQYIDSISDNLALAGFITGLMIHEYRVNNHDMMAFFWGGMLLVGFVIILLIMIDFLRKNTDSASFVTFDKEFLQKLSPKDYPKWLLFFIKYAKYTMKKDFFSFMFLVFAIFGVLPWFFYISILGTWVTIVILIYLNLRTSQLKRRKKKLAVGAK